jgi:hypothetical protein
VLSANGSQTTDGGQYRRASGTSMSAAFVSGAVACLRSAAPTLTPAAIATLLHDTAWRGTAGLPSGPAGSDPRWQVARGFGAVDLFAAQRELLARDHTQVVRLQLEPSASTIAVQLRTQRERDVTSFDFERAPDVAGSPGAFAVLDAVAAAGDSSLADLTNRRVYVRTWSVPGSERGMPFWYRVAWTEGAIRMTTEARRVVSPVGPSAATLEVTVVHNAFDEDVDATSINGNVAWTFRIEVPTNANSWLPPSPSAPWWLRVTEGGFLNRSGRVTQYRLIQHTSGGDVVYAGGPLPLTTIEGQTVAATLPANAVGVGPTVASTRSLRVGPNPARLGSVVEFSAGAQAGGNVEVFDLEGRRVARVAFGRSDGARRAQWALRDQRGQPVRPGVYLARSTSGGSVRLVILSR